MSGGKDKGKAPERHSTRKGAGSINKFTYKQLGTGGGTRLSMSRTSTTDDAVVISSDEEDDTTSVVAPTGSGWGGFAPAPPPPPMAAVGGAATGVVAARVAALEASTGVVVSRTFPLLVRTRAVDAETQTDNGTTEVATQTDDMVLWSCHSCSPKK
jgi:outer membrane lipoprotein SlyB